MKKLLFSAFLATAAGSAFATAAIEQVIVRQQWPWSTDVKVEYKIKGIVPETPVNLQVEAFNGGVPLDSSKLRSSITGNLYGISTDGIGQLIIDPVKAFGQEQVALANFKVKLTVSEDPSMADVIYKIYDLTTAEGVFPCTDVTRADLLNGKYGAVETNYAKLGDGFSTPLDDVLIWTGVTNYPGAKTTKLVMRRIPAKNKTWKMGAEDINNFKDLDNAKLRHDVTLTQDYYIGVFEVTQEQYRKLTRGWWAGSGFKGETLPVENAAYSVFQGVITGTIATNLGVPVDYPTEAQWEYACRAGTTSELYTGKLLGSDNLTPIAWHSGISGSTTHEVGTKLPNAFGLYDMLGNVSEACKDFWLKDAPGYVDGAAVENPCVTAAQAGSSNYVMRGGAYNIANFQMTSPGRNSQAGGWNAYGFRIAFTVAD